MNKQLISFRLWGDYGLYKKPWCNREQQSFLIPTKTALIGMIGGILGFGKKEYLKFLPFNKIWVGIKLRKKINKELHGYNFMQSAGLLAKTRKLSNPYRDPPGKGMRSPNRLEMLKNPDYNVFFHFEDKKLQQSLYENLSESKFVFPPYLGQVNFFANIENVRKRKLTIKAVATVHSVVPAKILNVLGSGGQIYTERIPVKMEHDRSAPEFLRIALRNEENATIKIKKTEEFLVGQTEEGNGLVLF